MRKFAATIFITISFVLILNIFNCLSYQASAQTEIEKFSPLVSSSEYSISDYDKATLKIVSEVTFVGRLVDDSTWAKMTSEEKKAGYASVYHYKYTFTNVYDGTIKLRFTFAEKNVLSSPLFQFYQDLSITLEPGQSKIVSFIANTMPSSVVSGIVVMGWFKDKNKWFLLGASLSSLYIPQLNAIAKEIYY